MTVSLRPSQRFLFCGGILGILACLSLTMGSALAAPAPRAELTRLLACRNITADAARLRCFDRMSTVLARAETALRAGGVASTGADSRISTSSGVTPAGASPSPAASDPRQTFGLSSEAILAREVRSGARREDLSSITAHIRGLGAAPDGRMIYSLDNGQTWRELLADGEAPPVKSGERVKIRRGWLGSYWLQTPSGQGCKVERLH